MLIESMLPAGSGQGQLKSLEVMMLFGCAIEVKNSLKVGGAAPALGFVQSNKSSVSVVALATPAEILIDCGILGASVAALKVTNQSMISLKLMMLSKICSYSHGVPTLFGTVWCLSECCCACSCCGGPSVQPLCCAFNLRGYWCSGFTLQTLLWQLIALQSVYWLSTIFPWINI